MKIWCISEASHRLLLMKAAVSCPEAAGFKAGCVTGEKIEFKHLDRTDWDDSWKAITGIFNCKLVDLRCKTNTPARTV